MRTFTQMLAILQAAASSSNKINFTFTDAGTEGIAFLVSMRKVKCIVIEEGKMNCLLEDQRNRAWSSIQNRSVTITLADSFAGAWDTYFADHMHPFCDSVNVIQN